MATQLEDLERAVSLFEQISRLKTREVDLEVECIAAQSGERFKSPDCGRNITVETAAAIVLTLDRRRSLMKRIEGSQPASSIDLAPLIGACDALRTWLDADRDSDTQKFSNTVRGVLMIVSLGAVLAGIFVHWAFLILLMPVGATSALMWSGSDSNWKRLGAKRRYETIGLANPKHWTDTGVRSKLDALQAELERRSSPAPEPGAGEDSEALLLEVDQLDTELALLLDSLDMEPEDLDSSMERELRSFAAAFIARQDLATVQSELGRLTEECEALRNRIYRFLHREGEAPPGGKADLDQLREGLLRVSSRHA